MIYTETKTNAIKVQGIGQMLKNKFTRSQAIYRINEDGNQTVIFDGVEMPKNEFESKYPLNMRPIEKHGKNSNTTKEWMYV